MNEIITKLNEIEEKADAIIADAQDRKEQMMTQLETDKAAIDAKYDKLEQEAAETYRNKHRRAADEQLRQREIKNREALEQLEATFLEQKEKLAEEIFQRMIQ